MLRQGSTLLLLLLLALAIAGPASGAKRLVGTLVATKHPIDPASPSALPDAEASAVREVARSGDGWRFHFFAAFHGHAVGRRSVKLTFWVPAGGGKRKIVHAYSLRVSPKAAKLAGEILLRAEDGFQPGAYGMEIAHTPVPARGGVTLR